MTAGTALTIAVAVAPQFGISPGPGLDPSWQAALHMAARHDLEHGRDLVFTYGPLGFLTIPRLYSGLTGGAAFVYTMLVHIVTTAVLLRAFLRTFPVLASIVATVVVLQVVTLLGPSEQILVPYFVVCVMVARGAVPARMIPHLPWLLGAIAGLHLLFKFNTGVVMVGLSFLTVAAEQPRRVRLAVAGGAAAGAAVVGWMLTGQPLGALLDYVRNGIRISSGYSAAMVLEEAGREGEYLLAAVCGAVLLAMVAGSSPAAWRAPRNSHLRSGLVLVMTTTLLFAVFKHGFVRHDVGHSSIYFAVVVGAAAAFPIARQWAPFFVAGLALLSFTALDVGGRPLSALFDFDRGFDLASQTSDLVIPSRRASVMASAKEAMRSSYGLSDDTLMLLRHGGVHVEPWETTLVWAYDLPWRPLPVFQPYSAYTPSLDGLNADHLKGDKAPRWIVREQISSSVDGRNPDFESPEAAVAIVCNYRQVTIDGRWQILERGRDRCGEEAPIGAFEFVEGEVVEIPRAPSDTIVIARLSFDEGLLDRLRALLFRAPQAYIVVDDTRYRLVAATAQNGLLLQVRTTDVGLDPAFGLVPQSSRLSVDQTPGSLGGTVTFAVIPLSQ